MRRLIWAHVAFLQIAVGFSLSGCAHGPASAYQPPPDGKTIVGFTGSMLPEWKGGEVIRIVPVSFDSLETGMVVVRRVHWTPEGCVMHRVIRHWRGRWITKGDNSDHADPGYMTPEDFVGVVKRSSMP